jgi:nitric oxide reductase subunit B
MVFAALLPLGVIQLYHSVNVGYFEARSLAFLTQPGNRLLEWMRMPGDVIFIIGGVLPFMWVAWVGVRSFFQHRESAEELPENPLYTELSAAAAAAGAEEVR